MNFFDVYVKSIEFIMVKKYSNKRNGVATVSASISGLTVVGAGYFGLITTRIGVNSSRGIIINLIWVGIFTVSKQ